MQQSSGLVEMFEFPQTLLTDMEFKDVAEIQSFLKEEADGIGKPYHKLFIGNRDFKPSVNFWARVRYRCKLCGSNLYFSKRGDVLVPTAINANHLHTSSMSKTMITGRRRKTAASNKKGSTVVDLARKDSAQSITDQTSVSEINAVEWNSPAVPIQNQSVGDAVETLLMKCNLIKEWLEEREYATKFEILTDPTSEIFVAVSPSMRQSYARFGDILRFDVVDISARLLTSKRYKVGVFSVGDTNDRPLIVGIAFLADQTANTKLVEGFVMLHGSFPATLVARFNSTQPLLDLLPNHPLARTYTNIEPKRQPEVAARNLRTVFVSANAYIGLNAASSGKLRKQLKQALSASQSLYSAVLNVEQLEYKLLQNTNVFAEYPSNIGQQFGSERLHELRNSCEKKVVQRFMLNYVEANRDWRFVLPLEQDNNKEWIVQSIKEASLQLKYKIRDLKCECMQFQKTGVACPHLILTRIFDESASYLDLVSARWKVDRRTRTD